MDFDFEQNELVFLLSSSPKEGGKCISHVLEILKEILIFDLGFVGSDINFESLLPISLTASVIFPLYQGKRIKIDESYEKLFHLRYSFLKSPLLWKSTLLCSDLKILLYFSEFPAALAGLVLNIIRTSNDFLFLASNEEDLTELKDNINEYLNENKNIISTCFASSFEYSLAFEIIEYYGRNIYNDLINTDRLSEIVTQNRNIIFHDLSKPDLKREVQKVILGKPFESQEISERLPWFVKYELVMEKFQPNPIGSPHSREEILAFLLRNCYNSEDLISKEEFSSFSLEELKNVFGLTKDNEVLIPIYPEDGSEPYFFPRGVGVKLFCYDIVSFIPYGTVLDPVQRKKIPQESKYLLQFYSLIKAGYLFYPSSDDIILDVINTMTFTIFEESDRVFNTLLTLSDGSEVEGPDFIGSREDILENFNRGYYFSLYFYQYLIKTGKVSTTSDYIFRRNS